jgi:DNA ligase (NAD+)
MTIDEVKNRINLLTSELNYHNDCYYKSNAPEISDQQFDTMMRELADLEAEYPLLALDNSPTQRVGSDLKTKEIESEPTPVQE